MRVGEVKFHPVHDKLQFSPIFRNLKNSPRFRISISIFYCYRFSLRWLWCTTACICLYKYEQESLSVYCSLWIWSRWWLTSPNSLRHTHYSRRKLRQNWRDREGYGRRWVKLHPRCNSFQFSPIFQKFWSTFSDSRLSSFSLHLCHLSLDEQLLLNRESLRPWCWVSSIWKYHTITAIQQVQACSYTINKSRTRGDEDLMFSLLCTRDFKVWEYTQTWYVYLWIDRILTYFDDQ